MDFTEEVVAVAARPDPYADVTFEVACAATAFLIYDTAIHLSDEVEYIWQGPGGWIKWAYVFIRHLPYLVQGTILTLVGASKNGHTWSSAQCRDWIIYQLTLMEALTLAVEIVLIARIYAMYHRNKVVLGIVSVLFVAEVVAMITVLAICIPKISFNSHCIIVSTPTIFSSYWTCSLAFETILFALTLVKLFRSVTCVLGRHSIVFVLVRDGTWAYAIIFAIMLLNTMMYQLVKNTLAGVCFFWELAIMSFAGSHVLLNLRKLALEPHGMSIGTSFWADDELLHFSPPPSRFELGNTGAAVIELQNMASGVTVGEPECIS
ncbi:hypothetical protein A0H81_02321 [Grifola frondosa]|uniref:DUF6533 domain-containing protein n=1 Tax=Grifola frondosa TaxID=5627 RepID=A0A1C7MMJ9_GRIFR|nr:hypothetical protein A0H81_02321 [Grifola frondosa]